MSQIFSAAGALVDRIKINAVSRECRDGRALCAPAYEPVVRFPVKVDDTGVWTRDDRE